MTKRQTDISRLPFLTSGTISFAYKLAAQINGTAA